MLKGARQDIQDKKAHLRQYFKELRNKLTEEDWKKKSKFINHNFLSSFLYRDFHRIAFYYPVNREVDLRPSLRRALDEKDVYLPRTDLLNKCLTFHRVTDLEDLIPGPFGILEPRPYSPEIVVDNLEVILIPGIAFDRRKGRLGYGGGYYDRILSGYRGLKVGVAFSFQIVEEIDLEDHDIKMDFLLTEEGIL